MTTTTLLTTAVKTRPRLMSRPLLLRFVSIVACSVSFFLPLAVVPLLAQGESQIEGGLANGALLAATVIGELVSPWLMRRFGTRAVLAAGLVLLGAPTFVMLATTAVPALVAIGVLRGFGFALAIVAGGAVTAALVPVERRGEGLAVAGLVSAIPSLAALPLGVTLASVAGADVVFMIAAAAPLLAVVSVAGLPGREARASSRASRRRALAADPGASPAAGIVDGLRSPALLRPALVFAGSAAVAGVVVTCVPGALVGGAASVAPLLLLLQPATAAIGRWVAGRYGDRLGHRRLFLPGVILSAAGMAGMAATSSAALVLIGAAVFGFGFGALQNATIADMYDHAHPEQYGIVSALWNAGYDGGMAVGALAVSALGALVGAGPAFLALALVLPFVLTLVRRTTAA
jgi:MFS family permease